MGILQVTDKIVTRMFIDPASISSGWAIFVNKELFRSGSVVVKHKDPIVRLVKIFEQYKSLANNWPAEEVHIEQFGGRPHHLLHWSVGVIGTALKTDTNVVKQDVPVKAWQKFVDWEGSRELLVDSPVNTEDELAAIGMGLYWVNR
jgi:hypothetical protein